MQTEEFTSWYAGSGGGESDKILFCYGDLGVGKLILGNKGGPRGMEGEGQVLTSCDFSSLVIDSLCDQAREKAAVACFYFDFAESNRPKVTKHANIRY